MFDSASKLSLQKTCCANPEVDYFVGSNTRHRNSLLYILKDHENLQLKLEQIASESTEQSSEKPSTVEDENRLPNMEAGTPLSENMALHELKETYEQTLSQIENVSSVIIRCYERLQLSAKCFRLLCQ